MKKVLLVATVQSHIAQFHKPLIAWLTEHGCQLDVAARDNLSEKPNLFLDIKGEKFNVPFSRSPFSFKNITAYKQLSRIINNGDYDIVHCNTPVGGILTRIAANRRRKKGEIKVIYEAHGFHFFKGAPLLNWIIYYPIEKLFAHFTDVIITINKEDFALAKKKLKAKKVEYIPGVGVEIEKFKTSAADKLAKRRELAVPENAKIIFSIGELNKNKNHQTVIRAIDLLKDKNLYYLIAGNGPKKDELVNLINKLGLENNVRLLGYRRDISELCKAADVYVFPSFREGLSVSIMEAMASGLPVACGKIRGNTDLIDENGGILFNPNSIEDVKNAITKILSSAPDKYGSYNTEKVKQFSAESVIRKLENIYKDLI